MSSFIPLFTRAGLVAVRNAEANGLQAAIASIGLGRGATGPGGTFIGYTPDGSETGLKNPIAQAPILSGTPLGGVAGSDPIGFQVLSVFGALTPGSQPAAVQEVGIFLDDGTLLCIWSSADAAGVIGSITANAVFELAFDLYLTAVPVSALTITVQETPAPDNLACLAQLLRGVARNTTGRLRSAYRHARRGIRD